MRSRSVAIALMLSLLAGGGAVWCYQEASRLRTEGNWLMLRGNAQAEEYADSLDDAVAETQLATFERRRSVLERAHFWQRLQMLLVLLCVVAACSTYILYLFFRLRQQLVQAGEGLESSNRPASDSSALAAPR